MVDNLGAFLFIVGIIVTITLCIITVIIVQSIYGSVPQDPAGHCDSTDYPYVLLCELQKQREFINDTIHDALQRGFQNK